MSNLVEASLERKSRWEQLVVESRRAHGLREGLLEEYGSRHDLSDGRRDARAASRSHDETHTRASNFRCNTVHPVSALCSYIHTAIKHAV